METGYLELVNALKTLNQQMLKKWDQSVLCEIVSKNNDGTYNIRMLSDEGQNGTVIRNIRNGSKYSFNEGDQGVLFKYKNQITMSFLVFKIGATDDDVIAGAGVGGDVIIPSLNPCGNDLTPIYIDSSGTAQEVDMANMTVGHAAALASTVNVGDAQHPVWINNGIPEQCTYTPGDANYANYAGVAEVANSACIANTAATASAPADVLTFQANEARFINGSSPGWTAVNISTPYTVLNNGVYFISIRYQQTIGGSTATFGTTGVFSIFGSTTYQSLIQQVGECRVISYSNRAVGVSPPSGGTLVQIKAKRIMLTTGL